MKNDGYSNWRKSYLNQLKKEKQHRKTLILFALVLTPIIVCGCYVCYSGNWKFIGEKTSIIKANIYQTQKIKLTRASSTQKIYFKYQVDKKTYTGTTLRGHDFTSEIEKYVVDDYVILKISNSHPEKHTVIGFQK